MVEGGSGRLATVPLAAPTPTSWAKPVPGNRYRPDSCSDTVSTLGSSANTASTPSPWWTSTSR